MRVQLNSVSPDQQKKNRRTREVGMRESIRFIAGWEKVKEKGKTEIVTEKRGKMSPPGRPSIAYGERYEVQNERKAGKRGKKTKG